MIAREYKILKGIEEKRAAERQIALAGTRPSKDLPENLPEGDKGDARDIAAAKVGLSGKTAETAAKVIDHIDSIKETDPEQAF